MSNDALAVRAVFKVDREILVRRAIWLFFVPIPDIALSLKHLGQSALHFGKWHRDTGALNSYSVANASKHIGNRVGHHSRCGPLSVVRYRLGRISTNSHYVRRGSSLG